MNVRSTRFGYVVVGGSICDSGSPHALYVVNHADPRPSANRVRCPAASYPNDDVIDVVALAGSTIPATAPVAS